MNLDGWNDNFNCGVLVCIINKEVLYKTPPNGWSGGGWRCGPHFTFPHQTRVHWFVSPPRLGRTSGHVQFWVSGPESLLIGTRPALSTDIITPHCCCCLLQPDLYFSVRCHTTLSHSVRQYSSGSNKIFNYASLMVQWKIKHVPKVHKYFGKASYYNFIRVKIQSMSLF